MLARALLTAELGCALTPAFSDDIDHNGCSSSPSLASAKGGCDYSRKCHTGVIRSAFGLSPSPAGRWCTDALQPSGSLTPLGPKVFTVTLEMYLAAAELPPNSEMCAAGSDSARLALRRTFSPQVFSCSVSAFILFCMLERERQTREKGTR